jgi:inosose dehydratase
VTRLPAPARLAAAPISWGICEVPGWGYQLSRDRVLSEMQEAGLTATEFGPGGFLPDRPGERSALLARYGLTGAGGFVPVVLHDPAVDPLPSVEGALSAFGADPAAVLVLAAATGADGYDARPTLGRQGWQTLLGNLDRAAKLAGERGFTAVLHPHVGTMVERPDEVERVLDGCGIALCLDTGHLLIGGTDPAQLARAATGRIGHVHLKDVDAGWAGKVGAGETAYTAAVAGGMFRPLGLGDVDLAGVVEALEAACYQGWYVLEQDTILTGEPARGRPRGSARPGVGSGQPGARPAGRGGADGRGPAADVRASLAYLRGLL